MSKEILNKTLMSFTFITNLLTTFSAMSNLCKNHDKYKVWHVKESTNMIKS